MVQDLSAQTLPPLPDDLPFELVALEKAVRYQQWIINTIQPYLGKRILELGAGIGNMSRWFTSADRLILTEMDSELLKLLESRIQTWSIESHKMIVKPLDLEKQTLDIFSSENIDTIVSFNVLEHIQNDLAVIEQGMELLRKSAAPGPKRMITFVPAHMWAYGVMDKAVGHHRRYTRDMFRQLHEKAAPDARLILQPFNFTGLFGWFVNGRLLQKKSAGSGIINIFEKLCPFIQWMDRIVIKKMKIPLGQSLLVIQEIE